MLIIIRIVLHSFENAMVGHAKEHLCSAPENSLENIFQRWPAYHATDFWFGWLQSKNMLAMQYLEDSYLAPFSLLQVTSVVILLYNCNF